MATSYPVAGASVQIKYDGELISYGQGMKIQLDSTYLPVRELGYVWPRTLALTFALVQGTFSVLDTGSSNWLEVHLNQLEESRASSNPENWSNFSLVGIEENTDDAPSYTVTNVRFTSFSPEITVGEKLVTTNIQFLGLNIKT